MLADVAPVVSRINDGPFAPWGERSERTVEGNICISSVATAAATGQQSTHEATQERSTQQC